MRRALASALCLSLAPFAGTAAPTEDWSARIARDGLAPTRAALDALAAPTPDDLFARGAVHFLSGVEAALRLRWSVGLTEPVAPLPVLRLALPPNPAPEPFRASLVSETFAALLSEMDAASAALAKIGDGDDLGLTVRLADLWFDIDGSGARGPREGLSDVAMGLFLDPWDMPDPPPPAPVIRFDAADAAWLDAYSHLLSFVGETVLAFDPTAPTEKVLAARADAAGRLGGGPSGLSMMIGDERIADTVLIAILTLRQQPDPARTRAAKADLAALVEGNRAFWTRVAAETDNQSEWIPNPAQTGAFGLTLPEGTGATWLAVLADLEALSEGRLLAPHFALPPGSGLNLSAWFENPSPLDLAGWLHGIDALPFAERGPVISGGSWQAFEQVVGGDSLFYALVLN